MRDMMQKHPIRYLRENLAIAVGLVLIWRGLWYALDALDIYLFGGTHGVSAFLGIVLGFLVLYLPKRDLRVLERL